MAHPGCHELWCDFREFPDSLPHSTAYGRGGEFRTSEELAELLQYVDVAEPDVLYAVWDPHERRTEGGVRPSTLQELRMELPQAWYISNNVHDPNDTPPGMRSGSGAAAAEQEAGSDSDDSGSGFTDSDGDTCVFCMERSCVCDTGHGSPRCAALASRASAVCV